MYEALGKFYDWFYANEEMTRNELGFLEFAFRNLAGREVRDVFDVTCGTGRQALRLAERGYRVHASDLSGTMLERLRGKPGSEALASIRQRSMADLEEVGAADAVVSIFTAFNHLVEDEEIERALAGFHRALRPGGIAVFDVGNFFHLIGHFEKMITRRFHKGENMAEDSPWDEVRSLIAQTLDDVEGIVRHREEIFARCGSAWTCHVESVRMRMFSRREVVQDLRRAGFADVRTYRDWTDRGEARENSFRLVFVARKAAEEPSLCPRSAPP